jgi:hypothetical protein
MDLLGQVGPSFLQDGAHNPLRLGKLGSLIVSELHGRYYEQAFRGNIFIAQAIVTVPVVYTATTGMGGPLLWNPPTSGVNAVLLSASWTETTANTTTAWAIGITGNSGQFSQPTTTTAIDGQTNAIIGQASPKVKAFRIGTVVNGGSFLLPLGDVHTGTIAVDTGGSRVADIGGAIIIPPGAWGSVSASAAGTAVVLTISLTWEEVAAI